MSRQPRFARPSLPSDIASRYRRSSGFCADARQPVAALPRAAVGTRIIMRPGEDGGVITQSEYLIAELASQEKLRKKCTKNS